MPAEEPSPPRTRTSPRPGRTSPPARTPIVRIDARGDEQQEVITGRRTFMLTTEERIITESKILDPANDPFKNGDFRPVVVPDSVTIESNPNAVSDEEIVQMFTVGDAAWPSCSAPSTPSPPCAGCSTSPRPRTT